MPVLFKCRLAEDDEAVYISICVARHCQNSPRNKKPPADLTTDGLLCYTVPCQAVATVWPFPDGCCQTSRGVFFSVDSIIPRHLGPLKSPLQRASTRSVRRKLGKGTVPFPFRAAPLSSPSIPGSEEKGSPCKYGSRAWIAWAIDALSKQTGPRFRPSCSLV